MRLRIHSIAGARFVSGLRERLPHSTLLSLWEVLTPSTIVLFVEECV